MTKSLPRASARPPETPADEPEPAAASVSRVHATSLFCDDIRLEAGGKVTIIGHYPGETCWLAPNAIVDRCAVYTSLIWNTREFPGRAHLRIDLPDREPSCFALQPSQTCEREGVPAYLQQSILHLRFSALRPGDILRAFIRAGDLDIPAGRLLIRRWQPPSQAVPDLTRH
jgi:hypothetical protein